MRRENKSLIKKIKIKLYVIAILIIIAFLVPYGGIRIFLYPIFALYYIILNYIKLIYYKY